MKLLRPQKLLPRYWMPIERELEAIFYTLIYQPVVTAIKAETGQITALNARIEALERALKEGKVQYGQDNEGNGLFTGKFNAAIGKEIRDLGGRLDARSGTYRIDPALVPAGLKATAAQYQLRARGLHDEILRALDAAQDDLDTKVGLVSVPAGAAIGNIDKDLNDIIITPELSEAAKVRLAAEYNTNMRLFIKSWTEQKIEDLRRDVTANARMGYRFDNLVEMIQKDYGTTQSKAKFLARGETSIFMSSFRKERLGDVGVRYFQWNTRNVAPKDDGTGVRMSHWVLRNRIYEYDHPPVVNAKGEHKLPGADYGCLCVDRPILGEVDRSMIGEVYRGFAMAA